MNIPLDIYMDINKRYEENGKWIVEGFAATTDFDFQEDIVTQQAIDSSSKDLMENSTVLYNHDLNQPIGKILYSKSVKDGLFIKVFISKTAPQIWQQIQEGVINKFSIRGKIKEAKKKWIEKLKVWAKVILKMQLAEVSLVTVPANPKAKVMNWYIEKALRENLFEKNLDLETIKGDEEMNENIMSYLEDIIGDEAIKANEDQDISKAEKPVLAMIEQLIEMEKDEKKKRMLEEIRNRMAKYPKYPYPKKSIDGDKEDEDVTEEELDKNTDEAIKQIYEMLTAKSEDVEKAGKSVSKRTENHLESVVNKLNEAIELIRGLVGKTEEAETNKVLAKFQEIEKLLSNGNEEVKSDNKDVFEQIIKIQEKFAETSKVTNDKVGKIEQLVAALYKGAGVVRNEDGSLSFGEVKKGVDERVEEKSEISPADKIMQSEDYKKANVTEQREMLANGISNILSDYYGGK